MRPSTSRRRFAVLVVPVLGAALALGASGCGKDAQDVAKVAVGDPGGNCGYQSGAASSGVSVAGDLGAAVTTRFSKPIAESTLQRTVVIAGKGATTKNGEPVSVVYSLINGKDGTQIDHQATTFLANSAQVQAGFRSGVDCIKVGSRVVATFPAKDLYGDSGDPARKIAATDPLVLVTDVLAVVTPPRTVGWPDAPAVTFHGRRSPQLTLPSILPSAVAVRVIRPGTGAVVAATDTVSVNYQGVDARTGKVFAQTYGKGKAPVAYPVSQFSPGFAAAIVGQRAGAQLIVSIPPAGWYSEAIKDVGGLQPTDTIVFVIEIQSTQPTP